MVLAMLCRRSMVEGCPLRGINKSSNFIHRRIGPRTDGASARDASTAGEILEIMKAYVGPSR
jgi:hypothetical protein